MRILENDLVRTIYLAGGCFWGIEAYFRNLAGIVKTEVGYANGTTENPSYEDVCTGITGHVETVLIKYDPEIIMLKDLLLHFFDIIDPTSLNRQGNDIGTQYRTGIYYVSEKDKLFIDEMMEYQRRNYGDDIVVEIERLRTFYKAEEYHQQYLEKNPTGYCHIDLSRVKKTDASAETVHKNIEINPDFF